MNKQTLKALKGSIKKWERIVDGKGVDRGSENCPLCKLFGKNECAKCIVLEKTGERSCDNTPYTTWVAHHDIYHMANGPLQNYPYNIVCPTCKKLAQKEVDFLKNLLPKEKK